MSLKCPTDHLTLLHPGTASQRDFSYVGTEIPIFVPEQCVGCMECVIECPDSAIRGKVILESALTDALSSITNHEEQSHLKNQFIQTQKFHETYEKKGKKGGLFNITIDSTKCKGCGECIEACGEHKALVMVKKDKRVLDEAGKHVQFFNKLPPTSIEFINEKLLPDMMLADRSFLYVGGAGSCMGCGEGTAIRMMLAATGFVHGKDSSAIVASTGCNTVCGSTEPFNPYMVPWTNSLFENGCAAAMGVRARWNQLGLNHKKLWVIGGDGAMLDIGFQSMSRMLASGMDINVLILDTQAYSNTGGQASTASFLSQNAKMASVGKTAHGKTERRKEIANIAMMHPDVFVAQTICAIPGHFYKSIIAANDYPGPSVINVYCPCPPEHGISDDAGYRQSKLAVDSRAFPLFIYDPRLGSKLKERLSLRGNRATSDDWIRDPKTNEPIDFAAFARTEGRFSKQFDHDGKPSESLIKSQEDRLSNWRLLQELAGIK